jgi:hypothetical protein
MAASIGKLTKNDLTGTEAVLDKLIKNTSNTDLKKSLNALKDTLDTASGAPAKQGLSSLAENVEKSLQEALAKIKEEGE